MSYGLKYTSAFKQVYSQKDIVINISKKNYVGDSEPLKCTGFTVDADGNEKKDDCILSHKATISFVADIDDALSNETFLVNTYDDWKVDATVNGVNVFTGFIEPSEQGYLYRDRPYDVEVTCTDGIGLLKSQPLTDAYDAKFTGKPLLIDVIAGALAKTNLELPIRAYCNLFDDTVEDRSTDGSNCMLHQTRLNYRTFLDSASSFMNCYNALEIILKGFKLFQHEGKWIISYIGEYVESEGPVTYYTDYAPDGSLVGSGLDDTPPFLIGKTEPIQLISANHLVSYQNAAVSSRMEFKYVTPDNLVNNQNLSELGSVYLPSQLVGEETLWNLVGWSNYHKDLQNEEPFTSQARIVQKANADGFVYDKYYEVPFNSSSDPNGQLRNYIRNDNGDFDVNAGDTLSINVTWKLRQGVDKGYVNFMVIGLAQFGPYPGGYRWKWLKDDKTWSDTPACAGRLLVAPTGLFSGGAEPVQTTDWQTGGVDDFVIPGNGILYVCLGARHNDIDRGGEISYFKDLSITYNSYQNGDSKNSVKGDYWKVTQNQNIKDTLDEEMKISDSNKPIVKGHMWSIIPTARTSARWHKQGNASIKNHYKYWINLAKYQMYHRRFKRIAGTFRGTLAINDSGSFRLPFHKHFKFSTEPPNRLFMLCGPVTINYAENKFDATFVEVSNGSDNAVGDNSQFKYIY